MVKRIMAENELTRRDAFHRSVVTAAAFGIGATTALRAGRADEAIADNRVRVGVIGTGFRGKYLIGNLPESARVTAICDCSKKQIAETMKPNKQFAPVLQTFRDTDATRCATYQDYRRMLDREQLDAVIIATPDHHHAQAAMLALDAGLDVYLEKPLTVTIREGRTLADKVKATGRVLQVGSQQRTMEINQFACEFIRDGGLGKISKVELPNYPGPLSNPQFGEEPIPKSLDWDLFIGPTPMRPYHRNLWVKDIFKIGDLLWRGWDLFSDYSGHIMTNWGAHSIDMMQYALGKDDTGPVFVEAIEPNSVETIYQDWSHKTPKPIDNSERRFWPVRMKYADGVEVVFTGGNHPARFFGERGVMKIRRNHFQVNPPSLITDGPGPEVAKKWAGEGYVARPHLKNWLDCIQTRQLPNAPVEIGHRTVTICHLANIARELARPLNWNPGTERFVNDEQADLKLERPRRKGFELR